MTTPAQLHFDMVVIGFGKGGKTLAGAYAKTGKNDTFMIDFTVQIKDIGQLEEIIRVFRSIPDVVEVYRSTT